MMKTCLLSSCLFRSRMALTKGLAAIALLTAPAAASAAIQFHDDFESAALDPFWSVFTSNGAVTFPSTVQHHGGSQAVQFNTFGGSQKNVELFHNFGTPQYGSVSVWVYDTGANRSSSNYLQLALSNSAHGGQFAYVNAWDYDNGPADAGNYVFGAPGLFDYQFSAIDRTEAWHQWTIDSQPAALTISIDGQAVYSGAGALPFDRVSLMQYAPGFRPSWVGYFDDFSATQVPEPSSIVICSTLLVGAAIVCWKRRGRHGT